MTTHKRPEIKYVGTYVGWPHCFEVREFYRNGSSVLSVYSLCELIQEQDLHRLLQPALDCCEFIPTGLSLKQGIAVLQLTEV